MRFINKTEPILEFDKVSKVYLNNKIPNVALSDINFQVYPQEVVSILGPSGCGKTTILRLICNIINPTKGRIYYGNSDIKHISRKRIIGLVPQSSALMPNRTVESNIKLPLEIKGIVSEKKVAKFIELLGLSGFEKFFPDQLSGGMRQRTAIARALVYEPEILLMDEPFASIDEILREKLNVELVKINRKLKQTVVFVTHNIEEAVFISDRILLMSSNPGKIMGEIEVNIEDERDYELRTKNIFYSEVKKIRKTFKKELC
ncbi:MAG: ABC transporter ATP-binding protein [Candidatus Moraniibacteriota bacterium]